jgi:hypothetical protein
MVLVELEEVVLELLGSTATSGTGNTGGGGGGTRNNS